MTDASIPAGEFGAWLGELAGALRGERDTDVACGDCTACCRSGQFIHIDADERDALAHIPAELVFPAPGQPKGTVLMGYDQHGRCPMLSDQGCTIYEHRPRTCRTYDCRVFAAADVFPDEPEKADIAARARRWVFTYESAAASDRREQLVAAAGALRAAEPDLPATPLAVRAVRQVLDPR